MAVIPSTRPEADDRELVAAVRGGDDAAFEELFRRYNRRVAGYVHRMVGDHDRAEDIAQEAFFSALRRLRQTEAEIVFKPWIFEIAKNATIDQFRRSSRAEEVSIDAEDGALRPADQMRLVGSGPGPDAAFVSKERLDHLKGAFDELSESHTRILVMRELEGLSYREIGERMNLTRPAVESTLFRARRRLNQEYADLDTGARCVAMIAAIGRLAEGFESTRDRRKVGRHVNRCSSCRRHARELGVAIEPHSRMREKVAALLPLPGLLRRKREAADVGAGQGGGAASQGFAVPVQQAATTWAPTLVPAGAETTAAAWTKAAAIVAAVALAGGGAAVEERVSEKAPSGAGAEESVEGSTGADVAAPGSGLPVALSPRGTEAPAAKPGSAAGPAPQNGTRAGERTSSVRGDAPGGSNPSGGQKPDGSGLALPRAPDVPQLRADDGGEAQDWDGDGEPDSGAGDSSPSLDGLPDGTPSPEPPSATPRRPDVTPPPANAPPPPGRQAPSLPHVEQPAPPDPGGASLDLP